MKNALGLLIALLISACGGREEAIARAERNLAAGDYQAAAVDLRNLVRDEPGNARWRVQHAQVLLNMGDPELAVIELRKARELGAPETSIALSFVEAHVGRRAFADALEAAGNPAIPPESAPKLARLRGFALLGLERYAEAKDELARAIEGDANDIPARLAHAKASGELNGPEAMKRELDAVLALAPRDFTVRMALGYWSLENRDLAQARKAFADALAFAPEHRRSAYEASALVALGTAELAADDVDAAAATHARVKERVPGTSPELMLGARVAAKQGRFDEAQIALQRVLSQGQGNRPAALLMGAVTFAQGKLALSEMYLTAALSGDAENLAARSLLAEVQLRQSKARQVLESVDAGAATLDPRLLSLAGHASVMTGDAQAAIAYFERGASAAPADVARQLELAAAYVSTNRSADALPLLERLSGAEAVALQREFLRLAALERLGHTAEVQTAARRLAAERAREPGALLVAARALFSTGDTAGARGLLDQLIALDPRQPASWVASGAFEAMRGDLGEASRAFAQALERDPAHLDALVGQAQVEAARGNRAQAISLLERARKSSPALAPRIALARLYLQTRAFAHAEGLLKELKQEAPNDVQVRLLEANTSIASGKPLVAAKQLQALAADFPRQPRLRIELARALVLAGRPSEANRAVADALEIDPTYWPALALATSSAIQDGQLDSAALVMARVREAQAPAGLIAALEGDLALRRKAFATAAQRYAEARKASPVAVLALKEFEALRAANATDPERPLREWLEGSPHDTAVRFALASQLQSRDRDEDAEREYRAILARVPDDAAALNNLAWLRLEKSDMPDALALSRKAYDRAAQNPSVANTYGWVLARAGRPREAIPILRGAYQATSDTEMRYHLAAALAAAGDRAEARQHLEDMVARSEVEPANAEAMTLLESLRQDERG
jgi:putative PEP-CTERM system TPR-repeat lipoprotein